MISQNVYIFLIELIMDLSTQINLPSDSSTQINLPSVFSTQVNLPSDSSSKVDSTTDLSNLCDYDCISIGKCNFDSFDNENDDFYKLVKICGYIPNYNGGESLIIRNSNGYSIQITTVENELNSLSENIQGNFSIIDFKNCADLLREQNGLNSNDDLVILKYENDNVVSNGNEKSIPNNLI